MDVLGGCPSHPEYADDPEGAAEAGEWEAAVFFGGGPGGAAGFGTGEEVVVPDEDEAGKEGANADCGYLVGEEKRWGCLD